MAQRDQIIAGVPKSRAFTRTQMSGVAQSQQITTLSNKHALQQSGGDQGPDGLVQVRESPQRYAAATQLQSSKCLSETDADTCNLHSLVPCRHAEARDGGRSVCYDR